MSQKLLILSTSGNHVRSEVWGWGGEDSSRFVEGKPIGLTPGLSFSEPGFHARTVLEAMFFGWKLLAPPIKKEDGFEWWLVKD